MIPHLAGPDAWLGRDMAASTEWIRPLSGRAIDELDAALRGIQRRGLTWPKFGRDEFPLPTFASDLAAVLEELEDGRGFVLLRGLPVERYTEDELKNLYWGVGAHVGWHRYQNALGELIGEVRDENRRYGEVKEPTMDPALGRSSRNKARSAGPLRFHTDRCDVVTLLTVRKAKEGGLSKIVSAVSVSNAIRERRPDLHALLCRDYWSSRQGEEAGGEKKVFALPLFCLHEGKFSTQYSRTFVEAAQKLGDVPRMTAAQDEALDLHAAVCEELCFTMAFEPGDIQLLNNHVTYHGRTHYEDADGVDQDRLLLRMWVAPRNSRPLPAGYTPIWGTTAPGVPRGGIAQPA
ncbi:MAG: TauD/TfdA family dioxygenase [Candidatus Rokubacteria bacterium]|nr:TauD/TfdA family dioxygenase [Candidatus Rokubacteria bacterium]